MALSLKLNLGGSTINLNDGTNYKVLDTWNPRVANYKVSQFGGLLYQEVVENIPLYIFGTTAALVYEKLEDIIVALNQARAWRLGAITDSVLLEFLPNNSSLGAVVQAACLGTPAEASDLYAAAQFGLYMAGHSFETLIDLPLVRRGRWLGAAETPAASSAVSNPGAMSVTFASSARIPSPVKLVFGDAGSYAAFNGTHQGFILTADASDKIAQVQAPTGSPSVGSWTTVVDADASGGSYQMIDLASGDTTDGSASFTINSNARLFAIYACVLNLSTTYGYSLKARLGGSGYLSPYTRPVTLEVGTGTSPNVYPRIEFVGFISTPVAVTNLQVHVDGNGATGAGNELGIDYWIVQAHDEFTGAVAFSNKDNITFRRMVNTTLDHRLLTFPQPRLTYFIPSVNVDFAFREGDLYLNSAGTNLTAWVIGTDPTTQNWHLSNGAGKIDFTLTATRNAAYLVTR